MIEINRWYQEDCTIGRLVFGDFQCFTLELPWENNQQSISCIESGTYDYFLRDSPTNGLILQLKDVPGRSFIQIHAGNYTSQIKGCILVGDSVKWLNDDGIPDVTNSKNTLKKLRELACQSGTVRIS